MLHLRVQVSHHISQNYNCIAKEFISCLNAIVLANTDLLSCRTFPILQDWQRVLILTFVICLKETITYYVMKQTNRVLSKEGKINTTMRNFINWSSHCNIAKQIKGCKIHTRSMSARLPGEVPFSTRLSHSK